MYGPFGLSPEHDGLGEGVSVSSAPGAANESRRHENDRFKSWTAEEEAKIGTIRRGHSRAVANAALRSGGKEKVAVVAKPKAEKKKRRKPNNSERTFHRLTPKKREKLHALIRKAIGKGVAVEGCLGSRFSNSEVGGQPYERYYLSNGHTCFVSGHVSGEYKVTVRRSPQ